MIWKNIFILFAFFKCGLSQENIEIFKETIDDGSVQNNNIVGEKVDSSAENNDNQMQNDQMVFPKDDTDYSQTR